MQWPTHTVSNQVQDLLDYNLFTSDTILIEALHRENAGWHQAELSRFGAELGRPTTLLMAQQANTHLPELHTHDPHGNRIDRVDFHPTWHQLLAMQRRENLHAMPWSQVQVGAHVARTAAYFLQGQIESGSMCPITMTYAAIPVLQQEPRLFATLAPALLCREHDARDLPLAQKKSILIGMGMTEKQGGSDVRSNTTIARAISGHGRGAEYALTGHKWFFSVPMSDAHLVLAQADAGLSCFFVPRWRPDGNNGGGKNNILIQRLKDKLGNRSNASSEVEFQDAYGVMVGEEGRGIQTIIAMTNHTRLDCVIGSAALMRNALVLAIHHAQYRSAFGHPLIAQPLMRNVLIDLALESEAATMLMMRLAGAADSCYNKESVKENTVENNQCNDALEDSLQRAWLRIMTPAAKFWICKRAVEFTGECMEVWGGNGYVEEAPMARMFREAPVNSIWEGSGNIMCLDVLRAVEKDKEGFDLLLQTWQDIAADHAPLVQLLAELRQIHAMGRAQQRMQQEAQARRFTQGLVLVAQACLMLLHAPQTSAEAFISSRFDAACGRVFGTLDIRQASTAQNDILVRAWPHCP